MDKDQEKQENSQCLDEWQDSEGLETSKNPVSSAIEELEMAIANQSEQSVEEISHTEIVDEYFDEELSFEEESDSELSVDEGPIGDGLFRDQLELRDDSDREIDTEDELEMFLQNDEENDEGVTFESDELSDELKSEIADSELSGFESAEVEDEEFIEAERVTSIIESILFATEKPQSLGVIKQAFKGTNVGSKQIKKAIEQLMVEYAGAQRGVTIEEISGGYQLRTKSDNMEYLRRMVKAKPFKLSGPALEVLAILAYKQPCIKMHIDEIRGVESGHLIRGLMEKSLVNFAGKSDFPGKPMLYQTTRRFLEVFGLRNLDELPTLAEIDELIPEGIGGEEEENKETLGDVADGLAKEAGDVYSEGQEELEKITDQIANISTSSEFFEQEKIREKLRREKEKAQDIRERLEVGDSVEDKDIRWLAKYDKALEEELEKAQTNQSDEANIDLTNSGDSDFEINVDLQGLESKTTADPSQELLELESGAIEKAIETLVEEGIQEGLVNAIKEVDGEDLETTDAEPMVNPLSGTNIESDSGK